MKKPGTPRDTQTPSLPLALAIGLIGVWVYLRMKLSPRWARPPQLRV